MGIEKDKWSFNSNSDDCWYNGLFDTKEEAIAAGRQHFEDEEETEFFVGRCTSDGMSFQCGADTILEEIAEKAYDKVGEVAEDYLEYVRANDKEILQIRLDLVISNWMKEFKYEPNFFTVLDTELVKVEVSE